MKNHKINNPLKTPSDISEMNSNNSELIIKNIQYNFLSCKTSDNEKKRKHLCATEALIPLYDKRILPKSTVTGKNRESNFCITDIWCKQPRHQGETMQGETNLAWKVRVCPMSLDKVCQYSLTQMDCVNFLFCEAHWLFKWPFVTRIGGIVPLLSATQRNCVMEKLRQYPLWHESKLQYHLWPGGIVRMCQSVLSHGYSLNHIPLSDTG